MIDGFPVSFFLPLVVHALAGMTAGITGVVNFSVPKRPGRHHRWGARYLWAYTVVFFTAIILSVQHWPADAYLFALATLGYASALCGYAARRFRQDSMVRRIVGKQWVVAHIVGMIGSYVVLWTAFYVDNAHVIPGLNQLPRFLTKNPGFDLGPGRDGIHSRHPVRVDGAGRAAPVAHPARSV